MSWGEIDEQFKLVEKIPSVDNVLKLRRMLTECSAHWRMVDTLGSGSIFKERISTLRALVHNEVLRYRK